MTKDRRRMLHQEIEDYLERLMPPRMGLLAELETAALARGERPSPEVGKLLQNLSRGANARSILQVGVGFGYELLWLATASHVDQIFAIDEDEGALEGASNLLDRAGIADKLHSSVGKPKDLLGTLESTFDLIFLRSEAENYRRWLDLALPKVRVGGYVVVENILLDGAVVAPGNSRNGYSEDSLKAMRAFNGYFMIHPQLCSVVLPVGRGVGVATKLKPLITELGGPF